MKTKRILNIVILLTLMSGLAACKKQVEIGAPTTQITTGNVFNDNASATAAQLNIYAQIGSGGAPFELDVFTGLSSDELVTYATDQQSISTYDNSLTAFNGRELGWTW